MSYGPFDQPPNCAIVFSGTPNCVELSGAKQKNALRGSDSELSGVGFFGLGPFFGGPQNVQLGEDTVGGEAFQPMSRGSATRNSARNWVAMVNGVSWGWFSYNHGPVVIYIYIYVHKCNLLTKQLEYPSMSNPNTWTPHPGGHPPPLYR